MTSGGAQVHRGESGVPQFRSAAVSKTSRNNVTRPPIQYLLGFTVSLPRQPFIQQ